MIAKKRSNFFTLYCEKKNTTSKKYFLNTLQPTKMPDCTIPRLMTKSGSGAAHVRVRCWATEASTGISAESVVVAAEDGDCMVDCHVVLLQGPPPRSLCDPRFCSVMQHLIKHEVPQRMPNRGHTEPQQTLWPAPPDGGANTVSSPPVMVSQRAITHP